MSSILESLEAILAAAEFGRTRETGEVTLKSSAVREAAAALGYPEEVSRDEIRRVMRMCGFRSHTKTATGTTYVMPGILDKGVAVDYAVSYATRVNHLEGDLSARLIASRAIPEGLTIESREFVSGVPIRSAAYLKTIRNSTFNSLSEPPTQSEGAYVALNLRTGARAALALSRLALAEHKVSDGSGELTLHDSDRVSLHVEFSDGTSADLSGGALVYRNIGRGYDQFLFFFTQTNRDF